MYRSSEHAHGLSYERVKATLGFVEFAKACQAPFFLLHISCIFAATSLQRVGVLAGQLLWTLLSSVPSILERCYCQH